MQVTMYGDWERLEKALVTIDKHLVPMAHAKMYLDGEIVLQKLRGHIEAQDLGWAPKRIIKRTPDLWVDTGELSSGMRTLRIALNAHSYAVFIGFLDSRSHYSGYTQAELAVLLEYGVDKAPARPLIRPTWDELRGDILSTWKSFIVDFVRRL